MKPITNRSPRPGERAKDTCRPQVGQRRLDPAAVWCSKEEAAIPVRGGRGRVDAPFRSVRPAGRPRLPLPASTEAEDGRSEGTPRWVDMGFRSRDSGYSSRTGAARPRQAGGRRARARRRCERRVRACVRPRGRDGDLQAPRWPRPPGCMEDTSVRLAPRGSRQRQPGPGAGAGAHMACVSSVPRPTARNLEAGRRGRRANPVPPPAALVDGDL